MGIVRIWTAFRRRLPKAISLLLHHGPRTSPQVSLGDPWALLLVIRDFGCRVIYKHTTYIHLNIQTDMTEVTDMGDWACFASTNRTAITMPCHPVASCCYARLGHPLGQSRVGMQHQVQERALDRCSLSPTHSISLLASMPALSCLTTCRDFPSLPSSMY